jgi:hypothetical protein
MGIVTGGLSHEDLINGIADKHPQDRPNLAEPMNRTGRMYEKYHPAETDGYVPKRDSEGELNSIEGDNLERQLKKGAVDMPMFVPQKKADLMPMIEGGGEDFEIKSI